MSPASTVELLQRLRAAGVAVSREGQALRLSGGSALDPSLIADVKARKDEIVAFLRLHERDRGYEPIPAAPAAPQYELSHAQRRLWIRHQFENERAVYNIPASFRVRGPIDAAAFERAINGIIARHESLRTSFDAVDGRPVTHVHPSVEFHLPVIDVGQRTDVDAFIREYAERDARLPFDLSAPPLVRAALLRVSAEDHVLVFNMHHIVSDGWSVLVLLGELRTLYAAFTRGAASPLPALGVHYKDFAAWQNRLLATPAVEADRRYWLDRLAGPLPQLSLSTDRPRQAARSFRGETLIRFLDEPTVARLEEIGRRTQATLFMVLTALVELLLYRYTGQREMTLGTPIAGRTHPDLAGQIGFYVNMLVLRNRIDPASTFEELLSAVKRAAVDAYEHQSFPFDRLVEELDVERDTSRSTLFDAAVALQNDGDMELRLDGLEIEPLENTYKHSKYDLVFTFARLSAGARVAIEYSSDLFDAPRIERMWGHFEQLTAGALGEPRALRDLEMLTAGERAQMADWNQTGCAYPANETIATLFESTVTAYGSREALALDHPAAGLHPEPGTFRSRVTYRELNALANQIAHRLRERGGPAGLVGIVAEPSLWSIASMIGVLKAGGAYVPVDPSWPADRIAFVLGDSQCRCVLVDDHLRDRVRAGVACIGPSDVRHAPVSNPAGTASPDDPAYVIYTSGSTGAPKGCLVSHRNVVRLMRNAAFPFVFSESDVWILAHSLCFDFSVWEMYGALLYGGCLVVPAREAVRDTGRFFELVAGHGVTVLNQTPAAFTNLIQAAAHEPRPHRLRYVIFGGAKLDPSTLRPWAERNPLETTRLVNMYGITETTVHVTVRELDRDDIWAEHAASPVGRPLPETTVQLLDADMNLVPAGVDGEMYVGGTGVCLGYLGRPELTAERFVEDPRSPGARLYRSGDVARRRADGALEFVGRADDQVKIRGDRVEPGEIEFALLQHPAVAQAHVMARVVSAGEPALVAYLVLRGMAGADAARDLREHLGARLPPYMVPAVFVPLDALPLTSSGKVDARALPAPEIKGSGTESVLEGGPGGGPAGGPAKAGHYDVNQAAMRRAWERVLGIPDLGPNDNFFELGGDSIKAVQIAAALQREQMRLRVEDLFASPTIAGAATHVERLEAVDEEKQVSGDAPLTPVQQWFFDHVRVDRQHWNQALVLRAPARLDEDAVRAALTALAAHHDALRMTFHEGLQRNPLTGAMPLTSVELRDADLATASSAFQADCDLSRGPLARAMLARCPGADYLLLVAHHLIIDGVSWRILLEDLATAYDLARQGKPIALPPKTHSYRRWASRLREYAESPALLAQLPYWINVVSAHASALPAPSDASLRVRDLQQVSFALSRERTLALLRRSHHAYGTDVNDLLLCALAISLRDRLGLEHARVALEGHGREDILTGVDVSRTVGWFTTIYPVVFPALTSGDLSVAVRGVKETLRRVPRKGVGYGILRYVTTSELRKDVKLDVEPDICFNYLGQFSAPADGGPFHPVEHGAGDSTSPDGDILYSLEVTGIVLDETLQITLRYRPDVIAPAGARALAGAYEAALARVIDHCADQAERQLTPSDVGDATLTLEELDDITAALGAPRPE
jgi:amino acid adenylation domain-containing protein/non-ribosomal peptide synthase protein (TIGR01720 family)